MKLLVDTCVFLWLAADDPQLSKVARASCANPQNSVYLSALSAWEIAIKHQLGRLPLPILPHTYVVSRRNWLGLEPLSFDEESALHVIRLPQHHRDPFDRGLVAQAT